jgi:hypothetical protein
MTKRIALLVCLAQAITYGSQNLTVCVRVETPDPHLISPLAQGLATRMFADVGIRLDWRACESAVESSQAPILIKLTSGTPEGFMPGVLGYAKRDQGGHIIIFFDRIGTMPRAEAVLAHVMVHEITHVVQGVSRHSHTGLMKAHWSSQDLLDMRYRPLLFSQEDLTLLYRGLTARREVTGTLRVTR